MKYVAILNGKKYEVEIERVEEHKPLTIEEIKTGMDTSIKKVVVEQQPTKVIEPEPIKEVKKVEVGEETIVSPLPGTVIAINVQPGDKVKFGQVVMLLEAMKMETEVVASRDGVIGSILVKKGDMVDTDVALIVLK